MNAELLQSGSLLGPFEVEELLGQGSFGAVYGARVRANGARVALKVLHPHLLHHKQAYSRFIREAQLAAKIRHPHVVDILSVGQEDRHIYYCMEHLEGEPLSALLKRMEVLSIAEAVRLLIPVIAGVAAIHAVGFVHRDLKPANIFLWKPSSGTIHPKILDFGVIKQIDVAAGLTGDPLTNPQMALGTPHYMSPEQVKDSKSVGPACDQWSLGVILYECLTGTRPFQGNTVLEVVTSVLHSPLTPPRKINPAVPEAVESVITRMLERDPTKRFPSVRAVGLALLEYADAGTRRRYGRELGLRDSMEEATAVDGQPTEDYTGTSILAPGRSMEFLVPLEQIRGMRPSTPAREFVPVDLRAERRKTLPVWAAWLVLMLVVTCGLGVWAPSRTTAAVTQSSRDDAAVEERPQALSPENPVQQVLISPTAPLGLDASSSVSAPTHAAVVAFDTGAPTMNDAPPPIDRPRGTTRDASHTRRTDVRRPTRIEIWNP